MQGPSVWTGLLVSSLHKQRCRSVWQYWRPFSRLWLVVHAAASDNFGQLGRYGVSGAKLAALQTKIQAYAASLSKPREAVSSGRTATKQLAAAFAGADAALKKGMDSLVD